MGGYSSIEIDKSPGSNCRNLFAAILLRATTDLDIAEFRGEAIRWIESNHVGATDGRPTFIDCCRVLGHNPQVVRRVFLEGGEV